MPDPLPDKIGRYVILSLLGEGGFGQVYLALDTHLDREVALKVSTEGRRELLDALEAHFDEARALASLDHPGIVPIHDSGRTEDGSVYLVSKYIRGATLRERMAEGLFSQEESARLVLQVAQALGHVHSKGFVHRDIKPSNIMLAEAGRAVLIDFGIALAEENWGKTWEKNVGTPQYMSPEQARGEGHLVDARSDIFSLGVVFYELLTQQSVYEGPTQKQPSRTIDAESMLTPRTLDASVPRELERICIRCLAKSPSDRYPSTDELERDLECFLAHRQAAVADEAARVVPKGLRSFGPEDASFFLKLLPGPTDREGLPESIRFWKSRIEEPDPHRTFRIGLLYGPSGCGKSSLVKAALLPRLSPNVKTIFIEASQEDTAERLSEALRREFPRPMAGADSLTAAMRQLRLDRSQPKVLIVIDQFEQWLHARSKQPERLLINALRQCDAERLQCLLLVRDDFWLPISRLMKDLQEEIVTSRNAVAVDLFEPEHAKQVLAEFGKAYGRLPRTAPLSREASRLLEEAVAQLGDPVTGKVVPVQLALFADMFKTREWTAASLRRVGGAQGIGVNFLKEHLGSRGSEGRRPKRQIEAARNILTALLPKDHGSIKGPQVPEADLVRHAGGGRDIDREVIQWLDTELRLITPVGSTADSGENGSDDMRAYQLTHDFLVPTVRRWLDERRRETPQGRAEISLEERADSWKQRRLKRELPSARETLWIHLFTKRANWSPLQITMMRAARLKSAKTTGLWSLVLGCLATVIFVVAEMSDRSEANVLVGNIQQIDTDHLADLIPEIRPYWEEVHPQLIRRLEGSQGQAAYEPGSKARLNASLVLHHLAPSEASRERLKHHLLEATPRDFRVILTCIRNQFEQIRLALESVADRPYADDDRSQLRAILALALQPSAPMDGPDWEARKRTLLRHLVDVEIGEFGAWTRVCDAGHVDHAVALFRAALDGPPLTQEEQEIDRTHRKGRAIMALFHFGHSQEALWEVLSEDSATLLRSLVVNNLATFGLATGPLAKKLQEVVENFPDGDGHTQALVPNLILSLGDYKPSHFTSQELQQLTSVLTVCHASDLPSWRSAAKWCQRHWAIDLPVIEPARKKDQTRNWYTVAAGGDGAAGPQIEMIRIPAPGAFWGRQNVIGENGVECREIAKSIPYNYYLSATEITLGQWGGFRKEHLPVTFGTILSSEDWPVTMVTVFEAMQFCNHLSDQEGLTHFYTFSHLESEIDRSSTVIRGDPATDEGYRLPTLDEWWYAAFSKCDLNLYANDTYSLFLPYAWMHGNAEGHPWPAGTRKSNNFGLFDMIGNVGEWIDREVTNRYDYGGPDCHFKGYPMVTGRFAGQQRQSDRHQVVGLRVAKTVLHPANEFIHPPMTFSRDDGKGNKEH